MVQRVDHVVDGRAFLWLPVGGAEVKPFVGCFHLGTGFGGADALALDDEEVKLQDELSDVLILPDAFVDFLWRFADLFYVLGVVPDKFLQIFLDSKRPVHCSDVFLRPVPELRSFGPRPVSSYGIHIRRLPFSNSNLILISLIQNMQLLSLVR